MEKSVTTEIQVIRTCEQLVSLVCRWKSAGRCIGVVPTMGALHEGHLSLVEAALAQSDETVVTIFVNPTQFAPSEDLEAYPRTMQSDLERLAALGVSTVFAPTVEEMYPDGFDTSVHPGAVSQMLEGEFRPSHFHGVATVVLKLLNLTSADKAFFGQKDYQQTLVVKHMVADLNVPTEVVICPIVRENDGLALSSRNVYLSPAERKRALFLSKSLHYARQQIEAGRRDAPTLVAEMQQMLRDGGVGSIDYAVVADTQTLEIYDQRIQLPAVVLVAARVGQTRLIDNVLIPAS